MKEALKKVMEWKIFLFSAPESIALRLDSRNRRWTRKLLSFYVRGDREGLLTTAI